MSSGNRVLALCQEIADWLRAVVLDEGEDLTPAGSGAATLDLRAIRAGRRGW